MATMSTDTRVLFVDDETRILEAVSLMLGDLGYRVRTASQPDEALALASEEAFDIVFIDQFLGAARGLHLMRRMAEMRPNLYFVIVTANGSADLAVESLKNGASDFIVKPFLSADLIKSIEYVNKKRDLDRQEKELLATLELKVNEKTEELRKVYFHVLSTLAQTMEKRDMGTYGHSRRVSYYSRLIAAALDLGEEDRNSLKVAAMLHDIGKIGTSDFVLGKVGPLDEAELHAVKDHPRKGVEILKPLVQAFRQLERVLPAILHHHENFDGSGYPHGLAGEDIPLLARIIAVADAYDAIMSDRPYRAAASHEQAVAELQRCAGAQFDPLIVNAFVATDSKYRSLFASGRR